MIHVLQIALLGAIILVQEVQLRLIWKLGSQSWWKHVWSWYVPHALPLARKLWNHFSIYHSFQSWIGHNMSSSKNKVGCMVIIFIKHLKDDIAWDVFWTQREHDKGCITTHQNNLHDGFSDLAGKAFTPLHVRNDPLIYSGHAVREGKSQP